MLLELLEDVINILQTKRMRRPDLFVVSPGDYAGILRTFPVVKRLDSVFGNIRIIPSPHAEDGKPLVFYKEDFDYFAELRR